MAQKPLDLQKANKIYELFESGSMITEIVSQLHTNRETVRQYLLKRYTPKQKRAIVLKNFRQPRGEASPNWQGGRELTKAGYVRLWLSRTERVLEHRKLMEDHLGRKLTRDEVVHHINGINSDNRLSNLQLTTFSEDIRRHNLARGGLNG
jgi:hypothetical protein